MHSRNLTLYWSINIGFRKILQPFSKNLRQFRYLSGKYLIKNERKWVRFNIYMVRKHRKCQGKSWIASATDIKYFLPYAVGYISWKLKFVLQKLIKLLYLTKLNKLLVTWIAVSRTIESSILPMYYCLNSSHF